MVALERVIAAMSHRLGGSWWLVEEFRNVQAGPDVGAAGLAS